MKKKRAIIIVSCLLVFVTGILATIIIDNNKKEYKTEYIENLPDDALALMLENADGTYTQSTQTSLVPSGYTLNTTKSYCINGGKIKYDKVNGKINVQVTGADKCYVYLDIGTTLADKIVSDNGGYSAVRSKDLGNETFSFAPKLQNQYLQIGSQSYSNNILFFNNSEGDGTSYYYIGTDYQLDSETGLLKITNGTACNSGTSCKALAPTLANNPKKYMINQTYSSATSAANATSNVVYELQMYHPSQLGALTSGIKFIRAEEYISTTGSSQKYVFVPGKTYYVASSYTFNTVTGEYTLTDPTAMTSTGVSGIYKKYFAVGSSTSARIYKVNSDPVTSSTTLNNYSATVLEYKSSGYVEPANGSAVMQNGLYTTCVKYDEKDSSKCDDEGYTYYFRGKVSNNWVKFADKYWRIVRVNENGTIRLIYAGDMEPTSATQYNGTSAEAVVSQTSNTEYTNTSLYTYTQQFYTSNLSSYSAYLADEVFMATNTGVPLSDYKASSKTNAENSNAFNASQKTVTSKYGTTLYYGNGWLKYKVGLLSATEAQMAGIDYISQLSGNSTVGNHDNWLYTLGDSWLMPYYEGDTIQQKMAISDAGLLTNSVTIATIRPVINLVSTVKYTGTGTYSDPYTITAAS